MTGGGNDMNPTHCNGDNYWGAKNASGGSFFST